MKSVNADVFRDSEDYNEFVMWTAEYYKHKPEVRDKVAKHLFAGVHEKCRKVNNLQKLIDIAVGYADPHTTLEAMLHRKDLIFNDDANTPALIESFLD